MPPSYETYAILWRRKLPHNDGVWRLWVNEEYPNSPICFQYDQVSKYDSRERASHNASIYIRENISRDDVETKVVILDIKAYEIAWACPGVQKKGSQISGL